MGSWDDTLHPKPTDEYIKVDNPLHENLKCPSQLPFPRKPTHSTELLNFLPTSYYNQSFIMQSHLLLAALGLLAAMVDASAVVPRNDKSPPPPKKKEYVCPYNTYGPLCCTGAANAVEARSGCNSSESFVPTIPLPTFRRELSM